AAYGADVVSRLTYAFERPDHLQRLRRAVTRQLAELIREASGPAGDSSGGVRDIVVAGNTAMNHLFLGVAVESLAVLPFEAVFSCLPPLDAAAAGLDLAADAKLYVVPNIRSFVGGDITAGLAASGLAKRKGTWLFVDLGTNGEIVLKKGRELIAASTAAGPAFEGMNISCGMLAVRGAVDRAAWRDGFVLSTIGNEPARGLCGTGILDVLAVALDQGLVAPDGKVVGPARSLSVAPGIALTQADVRNVQLAAAAVKSGVRMMLREFRVGPRDLQGVLLAGAFGNSLDVGHAMRLGLIPVLPLDRVAFVGNSSLAGAKKLLLSAPARAEAEDLVGRIRHYSLAADARFQDEFIEALEFKPDAGGGS
ncbi:MAG: ASKHA domain-containing protein, partial [Candidatus Aminicenantes bacterium]|nr:ASKHA domain-containing protein [Candidatus Aminicenantes bacterium]